MDTTNYETFDLNADHTPEELRAYGDYLEARAVEAGATREKTREAAELQAAKDAARSTAIRAQYLADRNKTPEQRQRERDEAYLRQQQEQKAIAADQAEAARVEQQSRQVLDVLAKRNAKIEDLIGPRRTKNGVDTLNVLYQRGLYARAKALAQAAVIAVQ
jgi:hypothetical protein